MLLFGVCYYVEYLEMFDLKFVPVILAHGSCIR